MLVKGRFYMLMTLTIFLGGVTIVTPTDKGVTLTLHTYEKSWNEAQAICAATGGNLFSENSPEKQVVFAYYQQTAEGWTGFSDDHIWLGLHSLETGTGFTWKYGLDCQDIEPGMFSSWKSSEPKSEAKQRCGSEKNEDGWRSRKCDEQNVFVCERIEGTSCDFVAFEGVPKSSLSDEFENSTQHAGDNTSCQDGCLDSAQNDLNCWAVIYDPSRQECTMFYTEDPFLLSSNSSIESATGYEYYVKACYSSAIHETDDIMVPGTASSNIPEAGCSSVTSSTALTSAHTTSSATTVPTPAFAGTTAPSTTSLISTTTQAPAGTSTPSTTSTATPSPAGTTAPSSTSTTTQAPAGTTAPSTTSTTTPGPAGTSAPKTTSTATQAPAGTTISSSISTTTPGSVGMTSSSTTSTTTPGPTSTAATSFTSTIKLLTPVGTTSASLSTTTHPSTSTPNNTCECSRSDLNNLYASYRTDPNFASLSAEEKLHRITQRLRINSNKLSATVRRKTCAADERSVSTAIGVVTLVFMGLILGLIVVSDLIVVVRDIKNGGQAATIYKVAESS